MTPPRASFQSAGVFCSLTKSGRIPSQTTTTTCRSDFGGSAGKPVACSEKTRASIESDVQYFRDMCGRRLRRFHSFGRARPLGAPHLTTLSMFLFIATAKILAAPLIPAADGTSWRYNMTEDIGKGVSIPDAKLDANGKIRLPVLYRINGTENVDGKDVPAMRAADGHLVQRISLEMAEAPKITARLEVKFDALPKQLSVSIAKEQFGNPVTTLSSNAPEIYARWQGQRLRKGARIKAAWIAENIGEDFPRGYKVDEVSATAESPTAHGAFTLTRPEGGWAPGDYRVEFYVDDVLVDVVKLKILK